MSDQPALWSARPDALRAGDVRTALRRVVETACVLTAADAATVLLYDRERALFLPTAAVGLDERWLQRQGLEVAQSLAQRAMDAHAVVEVRDTATVPELDFPLLSGERRPGAACAVALESEGTVVGALGLYHAASRAAPSNQEALAAFAALAGLAIAQTQLHEREALVRARLEVLDAASQSLAAERSLDGVLQRIVERAATVVGARYGALGVLGPDGFLSDFITTGLTAAERQRLPLPRGYGLLGVLIRQGQPLRVPEIARDPRRVGFPPHHPPMTSLLGVPVRVQGEVVGTLYLADKTGEGGPEFSEDDQRLVELLAAHAGIAIANARLTAREQETRRALEHALADVRFLAEAGAVLASSLDYEATLRALAHLAVPYLADWCAVVVWTEDGTARRLALAHADPARSGLLPRIQRHAPLDLLTPPGALPPVLRTGQPELMPEITAAHLAALVQDEKHHALLRRLGLVSHMLVPLIAHDQVLGALAFTMAESGRRYGPRDLELAQDLARRAALALLKARLYAQAGEVALLRERERISRDLHDSIIQDLYAGTLQLEGLAQEVPDAAVRERMGQLAAHYSGVIGNVRAYIKGLRAPDLEGRPLAEAIAVLVQVMNGRGGLQAHFAVHGAPYPLRDNVATALLQISREALSNVLQHAQATEVSVGLAYDRQEVTLTIQDDGEGFDPEESRGEDQLGLRNMRLRAAELQGTCRIESRRGEGTVLVVRVPAQRAAVTQPG